MIKTYGAFVRNVVDPVLDKVTDILKLMENRGVVISRHTLEYFTTEAIKVHIITLIIEWIFRLAICSIICYTVYRIL